MTLDFRDIVRLVLKLDEGLFMNLNSIISNQLNHEKSATTNNVMSVKALNSVK